MTKFLLWIGFYKKGMIDVGETDVILHMRSGSIKKVTFKGQTEPWISYSSRKAEYYVSGNENFYYADGVAYNVKNIDKITFEQRPLLMEYID